MNSNIKAVIGVAFGDEGKGATVNALTDSNTLVVRFNGGPQAGHTVVCNGVRHVFSHIGAGTLKDASTHLSQFFVCSPLAYLPEYDTLCDFGFTPKVSASPMCLVTTPWDVAINRAIEDKRNDQRHGSVGVGFGETIERSERGYDIRMYDLPNKDMLRMIQKYWVPLRCAELDIKIKPCLMSDVVLDLFHNDCIEMLTKISLQDDTILNHTDQQVVFEGAQGLLLDPEFGWMPHCTRSSCGLQNIFKLIGDRPIDVYYVSRWYTTRHGNGPLPYELPDKPYAGIVDETNLPARYQGSLRFSPLNLDIIDHAIRKHAQYERQFSNIQTHAIMTCLDQIDSKVLVVIDGYQECLSREFTYCLYQRIVETCNTKHMA